MKTIKEYIDSNIKIIIDNDSLYENFKRYFNFFLEKYGIMDLNDFIFEFNDSLVSYNGRSGDSIPEYNLWRELFYEKLKDSIEISDKDINKIKSIKGIESIKIINNKRLCFDITYNDKLDEKSFINFINFYGYTINSIDDNLYRIEATIPNKIKYDGDYVYHITNESCWNIIKDKGLFPKRKSIYNEYYQASNKTILEYPERIYCWKETTDIETIKSFIRLSSRIKNNSYKKPILLKINIKELNRYRSKDNQIEFYTDPASNSNNAIFTLEPISIKYIEKINLE